MPMTMPGAIPSLFAGAVPVARGVEVAVGFVSAVVDVDVVAEELVKATT